MPLDSTNYVEPLTETEQEAKDDLFRILSDYPAQAEMLLSAVREGRIDGTWYTYQRALSAYGLDGVGCVFCHIGEHTGCRPGEHVVVEYKQRHGLEYSAVERLLFPGVKPGDTPSNSPVMAHLERWILEWQGAR